LFLFLLPLFYLQKKSLKKTPQSIVNYIGALKYFPYFTSETFISNEPMWKFCIGGNGQVLSVVQHNTLEMRTEKHYNKTLAKATCKIKCRYLYLNINYTIAFN